MLIALLTDLHANREAVDACLADAERCHVDRYVLLGDYVGYGADPAWVVAAVRRLVEAGAMAVQGNHDAAIGDSDDRMNPSAQMAIAWTRAQLDDADQAFLSQLPLTLHEADRLYVHGDASAPARWRYIMDTQDAARSLAGDPARVILCGHVHVPAIYCLGHRGQTSLFEPDSAVAVPLMRQRRWQVVLGSVGQPRDGDPAASYAIYDDVADTITFRRVPYDVETAAAKIRAAGLPDNLAARLLRGR
jgi:diadenosine tetraphosphatase ApaH/serine/threonine PP2A family protein phosphatase